MRVRFLTPYRGQLTGERFYQAGEEAELVEDAAAGLLERGVVEPVSALLLDPVSDVAASGEGGGITAETNDPPLPRRGRERRA